MLKTSERLGFMWLPYTASDQQPEWRSVSDMHSVITYHEIKKVVARTLAEKCSRKHDSTSKSYPDTLLWHKGSEEIL